MSMSHADVSSRSNASRLPQSSHLLIRAITLVAIFGLLGFIAVKGSELYLEWSALNQQLRRVDATVSVGYEDITPNYHRAQHPANWIHDRGEFTFLWSGWNGTEHTWFRMGKGELNRDMISTPMGRDTIRAIDVPLTEMAGGPRWNRIPNDAPVIGIQFEGVDLAYPLRVLEKVEVVNDEIKGVPLLVTFTPFVIESEAVALFECVLNGKRVNLGLSGYFLSGKPLMYDRETMSFWVRQADCLRAIAGPRKGSSLKQIAQPAPIQWASWRSEHPQSRLVVGANRR